MPDPISAIVGSSVVGGIMQSDAADSAADAQTHAADSANATQLAMFERIRADLAPWRDVGGRTITRLRDLLEPGADLYRDFTIADFMRDPGYQFRMDEGQKAIERSAAARGNLLSGGTGKALQRYGQDYASNEYTNAFNRNQLQRGNQFNRLASVAGVGQTATQQLTDQGMQTANIVGQNTIGAGNARAAGLMAGTNAFTGTAGNISNWWQNQQFVNALRERNNPYANVPNPYSSGGGPAYADLPIWTPYPFGGT